MAASGLVPRYISILSGIFELVSGQGGVCGGQNITKELLGGDIGNLLVDCG